MCLLFSQWPPGVKDDNIDWIYSLVVRSNFCVQGESAAGEMVGWGKPTLPGHGTSAMEHFPDRCRRCSGARIFDRLGNGISGALVEQRSMSRRARPYHPPYQVQRKNQESGPEDLKCLSAHFQAGAPPRATTSCARFFAAIAQARLCIFSGAAALPKRSDERRCGGANCRRRLRAVVGVGGARDIRMESSVYATLLT